MAVALLVTSCNSISGGLRYMTDQTGLTGPERANANSAPMTRVFVGKCLTKDFSPPKGRSLIGALAVPVLQGLAEKAITGLADLLIQAGSRDDVHSGASASLSSDAADRYECVQFVRGRFLIDARADMPEITLGLDKMQPPAKASPTRTVRELNADRNTQDGSLLQKAHIYLAEEPTLFIEARIVSAGQDMIKLQPFFVYYGQASPSDAKLRLFSPSYRDLVICYQWFPAKTTKVQDGAGDKVTIGRIVPRPEPYVFLGHEGFPSGIETKWMANVYTGDKPPAFSELSVHVTETSDGSGFIEALGNVIKDKNQALKTVTDAEIAQAFARNPPRPDTRVADLQAAEQAVNAADKLLQEFDHRPIADADRATRRVKAAILLAKLQLANATLRDLGVAPAFEVSILECVAETAKNGGEKPCRPQ